MKYKINKKVLEMYPECEIDIFDIGMIMGKHGGSIMFEMDTDHPQRKITHYEIPLDYVSKSLTKIAP